MSEAVLQFARQEGQPLQASLRQSLIGAISEGRIMQGQRLPPSRTLARQIGIARNTVTAVYEDLVTRGYLVSVERRGYFVENGGDAAQAPCDATVDDAGGIAWDRHLKLDPAAARNIEKPKDWQRFAYPFVYGQVDPALFPIGVWRSCSRDALGRSAVDYWAADRAVEDDELLIEQICRHILPQRGVFARPDEVMVTLGSQHGLYILSRLLVDEASVVAVEDPGYPDVRNILEMVGARLHHVPVDDDGFRVDEAPASASLAVVTPAYQCPTMVTLSPDRRAALMEWAEAGDRLIVEDDYEGETRFSTTLPALKAMDRSGRVIYLGTLSKVLAPGVRIGYMVAPAPLIRQAKALRRLMHRSAPLNNQRTAAIFLSEGHYLGLVRTLRGSLAQRWNLLTAAIDRHLPGFERPASHGGSSIWLRCPPGVDAQALYHRAMAKGVLVELGDPFFPQGDGGRHIRLGISSIDETRIDEGVRRLAQTASSLMQ